MAEGSAKKRSVPVLSRAAVVVAALSCLAPALVAAGEDEKPKKGKRPGLELRSTPRFAFSPAEILFTAELKGGDDVEEVYCPEVEWEWGDGDKSVHEADCDPWTPTTTIQRRYTAHHVFEFAGVYRTRVILRKAGKNILSQTLQVTIRAGVGDTSPDPGM
jgi:hypothetical protein